MLSRARPLGLLAALLAVLLAAPAGEAERRPEAASVPIVRTWRLGDEFESPWQLTWIADGTKDGAIAFTDRGGNAVGVLDPATGSTQRFPLRNITSPNGIAPIDFEKFAVAGTGGVAIFDRSGTGKITELVMAGTRNFVIASGPGGSLYVPDFQSNDLRIIEPPYSGPADITKLPLPATCRGPTGVVPQASVITVLCQQTNNIVDLSPTGNLLRTTPLPSSNMGAQEARPAPRGFVFSAFNTNRVVWTTSSYPQPYAFVQIPTNGPAVSTVGYFDDPGFRNRIAAAAKAMDQGKKPTTPLVFNTLTPSFRGDGVTIGTFPKGASRTVSIPVTNLVGSAAGPVRVVYIADATPGKPAIHQVTTDVLGGPKTGRTQQGYRWPFKTFGSGDDGTLLAKLTFPFSGLGPQATPNRLEVGVVASSSSSSQVGPTFGTYFGLKATATVVRKGGGTYNARVQSADTGSFTRVLQVQNLERGTRSVTVTFTGTSKVPVDFGVYAQTPKPEPCRCDSLDVTLRNVTSGGRGARFQFDWTLECTGGQGICEGRFSVAGDKAARRAGVNVYLAGDPVFLRVDYARSDIEATCTGTCSGPTHHSSSLTLQPPRGTALGRDIRSVVVVVERTCKRALAPKIFEIAFGADGRVSERRSDLNGNGVPDGNEKK